MLDALLLSFAKASKEIVTGVGVEIDLLHFGQLPFFGQWTHSSGN